METPDHSCTTPVCTGCIHLFAIGEEARRYIANDATVHSPEGNVLGNVLGGALVVHTSVDSGRRECWDKAEPTS